MILAYTQDNLQPSFTSSFAMEVALKCFIYNRWSLAPILRDRQELGAHTGVLEFAVGKVRTFLWSHPIKRPLGQPAPSQCPGCDRLKPWTAKPNSNHSIIILDCSHCHHILTYQLPADATWSFKHADQKDERGAWLCQTEKVEVKKNEEINRLGEDDDVEMNDY
jgi:hypothetical protein